MTPEELFIRILSMDKTKYSEADYDFNEVVEVIQQAKSEWQSEIAEKIIEFDNGELSRHELVSFAYQIKEEN